MPAFTTFDGLTLHYEIRGRGPAVVLLHSFGFDADLWTDLGLTSAVSAAGRSAILPDARGHGRSDRPHAPRSYGVAAMAADVSRLLDHLAMPTADLAAYSMGAQVALQLLPQEPRIRSAVLGGVGGAVLTPASIPDRPDEIDPETAHAMIRERFPYLLGRVERGRADPQALAAAVAGGFRPRGVDLGSISADVLLVSGARDDDPGPLADVIPGAETLRVDADHATTMDHPAFAAAITSFLADRRPTDNGSST